MRPLAPAPPRQAAGSAACLWSVPTALRPFAVSTSITANLALGTVPGPPLLGLLQGWLGDWRLSMCACSLQLAAAAALFGAALTAARRAAGRDDGGGEGLVDQGGG